MIGNRVERDIKGANAFAMTSVWCRLSRKYLRNPIDDLEEPDCEFSSYSNFLDIIDIIEVKSFSANEAF